MNKKSSRTVLPSNRHLAPSKLKVRPGGVADKIGSGELKDLSFKVDANWHYRFKSAATHYRTTMKKILEEGFELWLEMKQKNSK